MYSAALSAERSCDGRSTTIRSAARMLSREANTRLLTRGLQLELRSRHFRAPPSIEPQPIVGGGHSPAGGRQKLHHTAGGGVHQVLTWRVQDAPVRQLQLDPIHHGHIDEPSLLAVDGLQSRDDPNGHTVLARLDQLRWHILPEQVVHLPVPLGSAEDRSVELDLHLMVSLVRQRPRSFRNTPKKHPKLCLTRGKPPVCNREVPSVLPVPPRQQLAHEPRVALVIAQAQPDVLLLLCAGRSSDPVVSPPSRLPLQLTILRSAPRAVENVGVVP